MTPQTTESDICVFKPFTTVVPGVGGRGGGRGGLPHKKTGCPSYFLGVTSVSLVLLRVLVHTGSFCGNFVSHLIGVKRISSHTIPVKEKVVTVHRGRCENKVCSFPHDEVT